MSSGRDAGQPCALQGAAQPVPGEEMVQTPNREGRTKILSSSRVQEPGAVLSPVKPVEKPPFCAVRWFPLPVRLVAREGRLAFSLCSSEKHLPLNFILEHPLWGLQHGTQLSLPNVGYLYR